MAKQSKASFRGNARNIASVLAQATDCERSEGLRWYQDAHDKSIADVSNDPVVAAGVVAALSPGLRWERNIPAAARVAARPEKPDLMGLGVRWWDGVRKAVRILAGESPETVLRGNKVRAFYRCILNPCDDFAVCVDGHAYSIWHGKRTTLDETPNLTDERYETIAAAYRKVAKEVGLLPMQVQAITWVVWRRLHLDNGQLRLAYGE